MKHLLYIILLVAFLTAGAAGNSPRWSLVWQDDFSADSLDQTVWTKCGRDKADWCNFMSSDDSLYSVHDGVLTLRGVVNGNLQADTASFLTGGVTTKGLKSFDPPCRVEVTARLRNATGAWPAIWLLPFDVEKHPWPHGGEIDIMEHLNHDTIAYQTIHTHYTLNLGGDSLPQRFATGPIRPGEFNTFAVEILPDSVAFFINDHKTFAYPRTGAEYQYPFLIPQYLLIDMQLGGSWVGPVDPGQLPVEMDIDAVRYYLPAESR